MTKTCRENGVTECKHCDTRGYCTIFECRCDTIGYCGVQS